MPSPGDFISGLSPFHGRLLLDYKTSMETLFDGSLTLEAHTPFPLHGYAVRYQTVALDFILRRNTGFFEKTVAVFLLPV